VVATPLGVAAHRLVVEVPLDREALVSVNIAKLIASAFARSGKPLGVRGCVLLKSVPGIRQPGAIASGTNPVVTSYAATGQITAYTASTLPDTLIQQQKRSVLLFGASISAGAVPAPGDRIVIGGETLTIDQDGVTADPVRATWICETTL
jgi:hypothetical protein